MNRDEALKMSDDALQELAQALKDGKSEKLLEYLGMLSRFHQYSFGNCIMIYMQKPDATLVAGFGRWKELHRFVKKGEKGIALRSTNWQAKEGFGVIRIQTGSL